MDNGLPHVVENVTLSASMQTFAYASKFARRCFCIVWCSHLFKASLAATWFDRDRDTQAATHKLCTSPKKTHTILQLTILSYSILIIVITFASTLQRSSSFFAVMEYQDQRREATRHANLFAKVSNHLLCRSSQNRSGLEPAHLCQSCAAELVPAIRVEVRCHRALQVLSESICFRTQNQVVFEGTFTKICVHNTTFVSNGLNLKKRGWCGIGPEKAWTSRPSRNFPQKFGRFGSGHLVRNYPTCED